MAKVPKPPKPKLPKAKRTIGQHIKNETRKAVSKSLTKNFGILGSAIAKKYIRSSSPSQSIKANPNRVADKKITEKKIRETSSAVDAIMESAHQVASALETTSANASRGFAAAKRQTDIMGEEVTKGLNELSSLLDRMLYQKKAASSGGGTPPPVKRNNSSDEPNDDEGSGISPRLRSKVRKNPNKRKPRTKERLNKIKSRLNRSGPVSGAAKRLGRIKIPFLNYLLEGYQSYSDVQSGVSSVGRATAGFLGGLGGGTLGALGGSAVGSLAGPVGTFAGGLGGAMAGAEVGRSSIEGIYDRIFGKAKEEEATATAPNKLKNTDHIIHKMKYKSDKIKFVASNTIEFKSKTGTVSAQQTAATKKTQQHNSGFFNNLIDKLRGGSEGSGIVNNTVDQLVGSPSGGAGTLNNLGDKLVGGRGGGARDNERGGNGRSLANGNNEKNNNGNTATGGAVGSPITTSKNPSDLFNPISAKSLSGFPGSTSASMGAGRHQGVDMMAPAGSPVYASKAGTITKIGTDNFGKPTLTIKHDDGTYSRYLHMGDMSSKVGDKVDGGQQVGVSSSANGVDHLHFERWTQPPNGAGQGLINPREEYGWDKKGEDGKKPQIIGGQSPLSKAPLAAEGRTDPTVNPFYEKNPFGVKPPGTMEPAKPEISNKETLAPPDQINKRPNYATDNERSAIKQPTSQTQDTKNDDLDHRPRQEAAPKQSFSDYMDTISGMEDAY